MRKRHFLASWRLEIYANLQIARGTRKKDSTNLPALGIWVSCTGERVFMSEIGYNFQQLQQTGKKQLMSTVWHRPDSGQRSHWTNRKKRNFDCMEIFSISFHELMHSLARNLHLKIYNSLSAPFEVQRDEWWSKVTSRSPNASQFDDWICTNSMHYCTRIVFAQHFASFEKIFTALETASGKFICALRRLPFCFFLLSLLCNEPKYYLEMKFLINLL